MGASRPEEIWYVAATAVRLLDGRRAYVYTAFDDVSRKILAWRVSEGFDPANTLDGSDRALRQPGLVTRSDLYRTRESLDTASQDTLYPVE